MRFLLKNNPLTQCSKAAELLSAHTRVIYNFSPKGTLQVDEKECGCLLWLVSCCSSLSLCVSQALVEPEVGEGSTLPKHDTTKPPLLPLPLYLCSQLVHDCF